MRYSRYNISARLWPAYPFGGNFLRILINE